MELASIILFVVAAAAWAAAVAWTASTGARVRARGSAQEVVEWGARHARIARRVAIPASIVALGSGIWAIQLRDLSIDPNWWIGTGIGAWVVCFLGSTAARGKALERAVEQAASEGPESEDVRWQLRQVSLVVRGELLLLATALVVIALMPVGTL